MRRISASLKYGPGISDTEKNLKIAAQKEIPFLKTAI